MSDRFGRELAYTLAFAESSRAGRSRWRAHGNPVLTYVRRPVGRASRHGPMTRRGERSLRGPASPALASCTPPLFGRAPWGWDGGVNLEDGKLALGLWDGLTAV